MFSQNSKPFPNELGTLFVPILTPIPHLSFPALVVIALAAIVVDIGLHGPSILVSIVTGSTLGLLWKQESSHRFRRTRRFGSGPYFSRRAWITVGFGLLLILTTFAYPAHAQFFGGAEDWMQTNFGANAGDAIPLVFNVLRGLFLLYVAISLVKVINAARQDEDWATIARTPLIIIIAVTAGDILTTLITG
jgi:hypothetical protein